LLRTQQREFRPVFAALARAAASPDADLVDRWRHEQARAIERFLEAERAAARRR
jgi:hypothetical protein